MTPLDIIRRPIEQDLEAYEALFREALHTGNPLLNVALTHLAKRQGKRMRPILVMLAARYAGAVDERVLHAAVAMEMLHTASLVHDDVLDESDMRRGQASVNALWGNQVAVLVGDYLLSKAVWHGTQTGSICVMQLISRLSQDLADGELLQLDLTGRSTFEEEPYYQVIDRKTAALFRTCAMLGAILGAADGETSSAVGQMERYGLLLGRSFQIRDDIFDFDLENHTGKPTGNDMREGKLTLPLLYVLQQGATDADRATALRVRRGEASAEEMARLVQLAHEGGGIAYAHEQMNRLADEAVGQLQNVLAAQDVAEALRTYAHYVVGRDV